MLGALTLAVEAIAPEDRALPGKTYKAASSPEEFAGSKAAFAASGEGLVLLVGLSRVVARLSRADLNAR